MMQGMDPMMLQMMMGRQGMGQPQQMGQGQPPGMQSPYPQPAPAPVANLGLPSQPPPPTPLMLQQGQGMPMYGQNPTQQGSGQLPQFGSQAQAQPSWWEKNQGNVANSLFALSGMV